MEITDLVVLAYSQNERYTSVLSIKQAEEKYKEYGFSVNIEKNTWSFNKKDYLIPTSRRCRHGCRWGIIGVYNRNNDQELDLMVSHSREATYYDD